jgi:hypothetical protein
LRLALFDQGQALLAGQNPGQARQKAAAHSFWSATLDRDAPRLGVRQAGPVLERRRQQQEQAAAAQGAGGGAKAVGIKAGLGVVNQIIQFPPQQREPGGEGLVGAGQGPIGEPDPGSRQVLQAGLRQPPGPGRRAGDDQGQPMAARAGQLAPLPDPARQGQRLIREGEGGGKGRARDGERLPGGGGAVHRIQARVMLPVR